MLGSWSLEGRRVAKVPSSRTRSIEALARVSLAALQANPLSPLKSKSVATTYAACPCRLGGLADVIAERFILREFGLIVIVLM